MKGLILKIGLSLLCIGKLYGCENIDKNNYKKSKQEITAFYEYGKIGEVSGIYFQEHLHKEWIDVDNDGDLDLSIRINGKFYILENKVNEKK